MATEGSAADMISEEVCDPIIVDCGLEGLVGRVECRIVSNALEKSREITVTYGLVDSKLMTEFSSEIFLAHKVLCHSKFSLWSLTCGAISRVVWTYRSLCHHANTRSVNRWQ